MTMIKHSYKITGFRVNEKTITFNYSLPTGRKLVDGKWEDCVSHYNVVVFRFKAGTNEETSLAERVRKLLCDGISMCWAEGEFVQNKWKDPQGKEHNRIEFHLQDFHVHTDKEDGDKIRAAFWAAQGQPQAQPAVPPGFDPAMWAAFQQFYAMQQAVSQMPPASTFAPQPEPVATPQPMPEPVAPPAPPRRQPLPEPTM